MAITNGTFFYLIHSLLSRPCLRTPDMSYRFLLTFKFIEPSNLETIDINSLIQNFNAFQCTTLNNTFTNILLLFRQQFFCGYQHTILICSNKFYRSSDCFCFVIDRGKHNTSSLSGKVRIHSDVA